jgi:hypothetical protein
MMAYIVGFLSEEEERMLKARGWDLEAAPGELVPRHVATFGPDDYPSRFKMVWVDASMFQIMSGPDWDKGNAKNVRTKEGKPCRPSP